MPRYKKRPKYDPEMMPGLFDDLETPVSGRRDDLVPQFPEFVEEERERRRLQQIKQIEEQFASPSDSLTPMEAPPVKDRIHFISFGSGSSGNCTYVGDSSGGFLIDAGVDSDFVVKELRRNGIDMAHVKGVVLTHDHSDHVRSVYQLVRRYRHMAVYCTPRTLSGMLRRHNISNRIKDYHRPIYKEHPFELGNFTVLAFEVKHDGTDNCGFYITRGRHKMVIATDLGCISERADYYMRQANHLMIEANYDDAMLASGSYPEYLKARIRSEIGHMNNVVTAEYLRQIWTPTLRSIFLCHLSKDNNTPQIALQTVEKALQQAGANAIGDFTETPYARIAPVQLMALPRYDSTGLISLRLE